jgi:uncharacterized protein
MIKRLVLKAIIFYQRFLNFNSLLTKHLFSSGSACRFRPTCSNYCYQAVERYGILKGGLRCLERIVRCHPFSKGGWDPLK